MNTNSNLYTVIYTAIIVTVVAAVLAFVSQSLKDKQEANEKAETISQMLTAGGFGSKAEFQALGNAKVLETYGNEIGEAFTVNAEGAKVADLDLEHKEIFSRSQLKAQNSKVKDGEGYEIPVFKFKNGITVVPVYGAGLWGPIWGYIAFEADGKTIHGAYFDHESETAGLGAKIKDDPDFQAEFVGEQAFFGQSPVFAIVKGGAPKEEGKSVVDNQVDAITGATMTSNGLDAAINTWLGAYAAYFGTVKEEVEE